MTDDSANTPDLPDLSSAQARQSIIRMFTLLQALELSDFVRMMSDFPQVIQATQAGDERAMERYMMALHIDSEIARQGEDQVRRARKDLEEQRDHPPIGNANKYFTDLRASASAS